MSATADEEYLACANRREYRIFRIRRLLTRYKIQETLFKVGIQF